MRRGVEAVEGADGGDAVLGHRLTVSTILVVAVNYFRDASQARTSPALRSGGKTG